MKTKISYASEEGLKELYRRAVSRIPDVDTELDYYSENPIANSTVTNALANLASYLVVPGTGSDHHPNIPSGTESEMVLYFVKVASKPGKDNYKEWIWTGKWECIGEPSIVVDDALNIHSMNPITNHAVTEALLNFGGFEKVNGTGADNHPDVANPSTKVIYLVEVPGTPEPDHCMEWIWEASGKWVCIGSTSIDVDTELDPVSGNPLANSTITAEIDRIDTRIDEEHDYTEGKVEHLEDEITRLDTTKADIAYVDQAILDNTFVAEFNVTTYDAVKTAYQSGKRVICKVVSSGTEVYVPLSISTNVDNGGIMFNGLITYTQSDWIRVWKENGETHWSQTPYQLADKSEMVITPGTGADFDKTTIQLKANTSATVLTAHQDISGKADLATTLAGYGITDAKIENTASNTVVTLGSNTLTVGMSDGRVNTIDSHTLFAERATNDATGREIAPNLVPDASNQENQVLMASSSNTAIWTNDTFVEINIHSPADPYNPLGLPPRTIRVQMNSSNINPTNWVLPTRYNEQYEEISVPHSWTKVEGTNDTWDLYYDHENWDSLLKHSSDKPTRNILKVLGANTSTVTDMQHMFNLSDYTGYADTLSEVALFDTRNVTDTHYMFSNCKSLVSVPAFDLSNVVDTGSMFISCAKLQEVAIESTGNVTSMNYMFDGCKKLSTVPDLDTSSVTSMWGMFKGSGLTEIPNFDTSAVTSMAFMFNECSKLTQIVIPSAFVFTASGLSVEAMFKDCYYVESGALALYNDLKNRNNISNHYNTFNACGTQTSSGQAELAQIPAAWKGN